LINLLLLGLPGPLLAGLAAGLLARTAARPGARGGIGPGLADGAALAELGAGLGEVALGPLARFGAGFLQEVDGDDPHLLSMWTTIGGALSEYRACLLSSWTTSSAAAWPPSTTCLAATA
jgi:hypothetical protein